MTTQRTRADVQFLDAVRALLPAWRADDASVEQMRNYARYAAGANPVSRGAWAEVESLFVPLEEAHAYHHAGGDCGHCL